MNPQLSSTYSDLTVRLGGLTCPVEQLCGGTLVCGMTGSGKTVSIVNPLALQFAALEGKNPARKPAIVYFALKGQPHKQFLEALPPERRKDVITISHEASVWLSLFHRPNWRSAEELNGVVVRFIEEFAQHFSDELGSYRHDPFWERQRLRYMNVLAGLEVADQAKLMLLAQTAALNSEHGLERVLSRVEAFFEHCTTYSPEAGKRTGLMATEPEPRPDAPAEPEPEPFTKLRYFHSTLTHASQLELNALVTEFYRMSDATKFSIVADVRGVIEAFMIPETRRYLFGQDQHPLTLEQIIHDGKILIVNLPLADGGNTSLSTLLAIKLALFNRLLGRNSARYGKHHLSKRPVCVVIDEFQNLVSKGRTGGEDLMMAQCREHGVIVLLASQSLSLLSGALHNDSKLAALIANCRTKVFGRNGDPITNRIASEACGPRGLEKIQRAPVWYGGAKFRAFVTEAMGEEVPTVDASQFGSLLTGQFYVTTADGGTYWLDLRHHLQTPQLKVLKTPEPNA